MTNIVEHPFTVEAGEGRLELRLRHICSEPPNTVSSSAVKQRAVLLLHGGNTHSDTFVLPNGGLAQYLDDHGYDVWLLDWRASPWVVNRLFEGSPLGGSVEAERALYTLDHVVEQDIPAALTKLRSLIGDSASLALVGHCLGAGALSLAAARGKLSGLGIDHLVLSTLGLFYEVPWNGWMKAEDFTIERSLPDSPLCRGIDPKSTSEWPVSLRSAYQSWPKAWLPPLGTADESMLNRLSFMFGQPYASEAIDSSIQGRVLRDAFGPMHLGLYLHTGQMVRRGYVAAFGAPSVLERGTRLRGGESTGDKSDGSLPLPPSKDLNLAPFVEFDITLVSAADNQLWHRDSLDLMYDWLKGARVEGQAVRCRKHVFQGYRLQELLWGKNAKREVFPAYLEGVGGAL